MNAPISVNTGLVVSQPSTRLPRYKNSAVLAAQVRPRLKARPISTFCDGFCSCNDTVPGKGGVSYGLVKFFASDNYHISPTSVLNLHARPRGLLKALIHQTLEHFSDDQNH